VGSSSRLHSQSNQILLNGARTLTVESCASEDSRLTTVSVQSSKKPSYGSPIKGDVKTHFCQETFFRRPQAARILLGIQPPCVGRAVMLIVVGLATAARHRIPIPCGFMLVGPRVDAVRFPRLASVAIAELATMVLSETRGL
jgi:hypothetical protein